MKKLLLFALISYAVHSQPGVEIRLVNPNVGTPQCGYFSNDWLCNSTNDANLNTILNNFGVQYFREKGGHPYYTNAIIIGISGNYTQQFVTDLNAYAAVVATAKFWDISSFSDVLILNVNNPNIGIPTGIDNNIIVTNDLTLNQIFVSYNVFHYSLIVPSVSQTYYGLTCDCDINVLKTVLENYNAVINQVSFYNAAFLANEELEKPNTVIVPNPFSNIFTIETNQTFIGYTLVDIHGKIILNTSSKSELDIISSQLQSGVYILNLQFENGQIVNQKLVKK